MTIEQLYSVARAAWWTLYRGRGRLWRHISPEDAVQTAVMKCWQYPFDASRGMREGVYYNMVSRHAIRNYAHSMRPLFCVDMGRDMVRCPHRRMLEELDSQEHGYTNIHPESKEPMPGDVAASNEDRARVLEAVYSLPPNLGFVVRHVMEGWPMHKIGREMCITRQAVHQRYHKGLEKLAEVLTVG